MEASKVLYLFQAAYPANYIKMQFYQSASSVQINSTNFFSFNHLVPSPNPSTEL